MGNNLTTLNNTLHQILSLLKSKQLTVAQECYNTKLVPLLQSEDKNTVQYKTDNFESLKNLEEILFVFPKYSEPNRSQLTRSALGIVEEMLQG